MTVQELWEDRSVQVAVVGAGYWRKNFVQNFHDLNALAVVCDSDPERLQTLKQQYSSVHMLSSYSEVPRDASITAVAISTSAESHAEMVREALLAGKDVLVEKPLCLAVRAGEEFVALVQKEGRLLMVGHLLWYHPAVLKLKVLVGAGELGRIQSIYSNRLNLGKIRREENILWSFVSARHIRFPELERAANETLALPIYPELTAEQQQVVGAIREFYAGA